MLGDAPRGVVSQGFVTRDSMTTDCLSFQTSGAREAAIVMRAVRNIGNTNRTIVCTIHQPSIDIFESFDELLLLKVTRRPYPVSVLTSNVKSRP